MKTIKLYEEYINSSSNRISTLLKNMVTMLNNTFGGNNSHLGQKDLETISLIDVEQSNSTDINEKNIVMRFSDDQFQYQMIFVIKLEDVKENENITKGYMKIKIYDGVEGQMLREWQANLEIQVSTNEQENEEGRFYVKVGENESQMQGQEMQGQETQPSSNLDFMENFIIQKIGFLKETLE